MPVVVGGGGGGGGAGCFNVWDIVGCGCSPCLPCALPAHDLTLSWSLDFSGTGGAHTTGTAVLTYLGVVAGVATWLTSCTPTSQPAGFAPALTFGIACDPTGGTTYTLKTFNTIGCTVLGFTRAFNTTTGPTGGLTIASFTCSPLNVVMGGAIFGGSTITP